MNMFLKKTQGSITVFLVMILVPSIFFVGFMDDLARMKLYSNQAVMVSDNYGDAILSEYDSLMKELYGIFSITQDEQALEYLDTIDSYMKGSFNPNNSPINYSSYTAGALHKAANGIDVFHLSEDSNRYTGLMPYADLNVEMSKDFIEESSLRNNDIFATQVGDFMRYRIIQTLLNSKGEIDEGALEQIIKAVDNSIADDKVTKAKEDLQDPLEDYFDALADYYKYLKKIKQYPDYIGKLEPTPGKGIIGGQYVARFSIIAIVNTDSDYKAFRNSKDEEYMNHVFWAADTNEDGVIDSSDDEDAYDGLSDDQKKALEFYQDSSKETQLKNEIIGCLSDFLDAAAYSPASGFDNSETKINCGNFDDCLDELSSKATAVISAASKLDDALDNLQSAIDAEGVTPAIKKTEQRNITRLRWMTEDTAIYSDIPDQIENHNSRSVNSDYKTDIEEAYTDYITIINNIMDLNYERGEDIEWPEYLDSSKVYDFYNDSTKQYTFKYIEVDSNGNDVQKTKTQTFKTFYDELKKQLGGESQSDAEKKKDRLKGQADNLTNKYKIDDKDVGKNVRSVPSFLTGTTYYEKKGVLDTISANFTAIVDMFEPGGLKKAGKIKLLKVYMMQYDFGMFSSRVTENKKDDDGNDIVVKSLTGYEMAKNINYMYGAELEYIVVGNPDAKSNLDTVRNYIVAFRMVNNFASTYTIEEINAAIQGISDALYAVPYVGPVLAVVVDLALRTAIATAESYFDWEALMKGDAVLVFKSQLDDLMLFSAEGNPLGDLFAGEDVSLNGSGATSTGIKLTYEQYLTIMLLFFTPDEYVFLRTQNLVELNVNWVNAQQADGGGKSADGTMTESDYKIKLDKAYTAVETTCTVDGNFIVLPDGFINVMLSDNPGRQASLRDFAKNKFEYKVIRSY